MNKIDKYAYFTRWWKDLSEDIGLEYMRDRIVECYFWAYSMYYEQEYARARMILVRIFMLTSLLDDTYDDHATLGESRDLTLAIERLFSLCLTFTRRKETSMHI